MDVKNAKTGRRHGNNYMLSPAMWRLSIPFFILLASCFGVMLLVCARVRNFVDHVGAVNPAVGHLLNEINEIIFSTAVTGFGIFGVLCITLWLLYSHRIFGAAVPIRKQVEQMIHGQYTERVMLRKFDELRDVADAVNRLSEILHNNTTDQTRHQNRRA